MRQAFKPESACSCWIPGFLYGFKDIEVGIHVYLKMNLSTYDKQSRKDKEGT